MKSSLAAELDATAAEPARSIVAEPARSIVAFVEDAAATTPLQRLARRPQRLARRHRIRSDGLDSVPGHRDALGQLGKRSERLVMRES